jgi:hypothetical protein
MGIISSVKNAHRIVACNWAFGLVARAQKVYEMDGYVALPIYDTPGRGWDWFSWQVRVIGVGREDIAGAGRGAGGCGYADRTR